MKKILIKAVLLFAAVFLYASSNEATCAAQMSEAYNSGFYPGVVRLADEIISGSAGSSFVGQAFVLKGESLFRLGRIEESLVTLKEAESFVQKKSDLNAKRLFWIGRGLYRLNKPREALLYFYSSAKTAGKGTVYDDSIFWSGKAAFDCKNFTESADCFEYVCQNSKSYSINQYEEAAIKLCTALNEAGLFQKALDYENQLETSNISIPFNYSILLIKGESLEKLRRYRESYDCYCKVILEGTEQTAAVAMQKAYVISSSYQNYVKEEPGSVIHKAQGRLSAYPELLSQFWTRLAVDAYNLKEYKKASEYFDRAETQNNELLAIRCLYETDMDYRMSDARKADAEKALDSIRNGEKNLSESSPYREYFKAAEARYAGLAEKWDEVLAAASGSLSDSVKGDVQKTVVYWTALAYYNTQKFKEAVSLLEKTGIQEPEFLQIKAASLARTGNSSAADKIFYELGQKENLNVQGQLDYTRTLLNAGHLISTVEQASAIDGAESEYMKALAFFNRRKWEHAETGFSKALTGKDLEEKYAWLARFYLGYSQYQLGKNQEACVNLEKYLSSGQSLPLEWEASLTAGKSAVQSGNYQLAKKMASLAVIKSKTESQREESILLKAGILTDCKEYDNALDEIKPYTGRKNEFAYKCSYLKAQILVLKGDVQGADQTYRLLSEEKMAGGIAEEACYRRAELFLTEKQYQLAQNCFDKYCRQYGKGQYYTPALYFSGDCFAALGQQEKAVLYYEQVLWGTEKSTYRYGAARKLVNIYKDSGKYGEALFIGKMMIEEYGDQTSRDGIDLIVRELKILNKGDNPELVKIEQEYEKQGKNSTEQGRTAGVQVLRAWANIDGYEDKAVAHGRELLAALEKENNPGEAEKTGETALILGNLMRNKRENEQSARTYLKGARYYKASGNLNQSARCMYGAAEAFDAAGMSGDSKLTVEALIENYPDSLWVEKARSFVK